MTGLGFGPNLALRRHRLFECADVDETRERIGAVMQPHRLIPLERRPARAHMDYFSLGAVGFGAIKFGAMQVEVPAVAAYHLVVFCLSGTGVAGGAGTDVALGAAAGAWFNPGDPFTARFSGDAEQFVVRIDQARMAAHLDRDARFRRRVDLARPELQPFLWHLRALHADTGLAAMTRADPRLAAAIEAPLLALLAQGQPWQGTPPAAPRPALVRPALVKRAEEFMRANFDQPITLDDMARAAGVAPRTLQEGFRRFTGCTPMGRLRDIRLDQARDGLARREGVSAAALRCGFTHLGRFARAYRARFGETPSATVRAG